MPGPNGRVRVGVIADTHAPRFWKQMPARVAQCFGDVDLILHAGDVCIPGVLDELSSIAPVYVVQGNNDGSDIADWGATETIELNIAGLNVAMIHDSGPAVGRLARMRRRFPGADLVVFGHSHIPMHVMTQDFGIFNPGSPTDKRRQRHGTVGILEVIDGRLATAEFRTVTG